MLLLDRPLDILTLVFQHVSPAELRTSIEYLLVSKAWYGAVLPVYLSGVQLSTIFVLSNDLECFPRHRTVLGNAIQAKLTRLSLCLDGLPSRDTMPLHDTENFDDNDLQWLKRLAQGHRYGSAETLVYRLGSRGARVETREKQELESRLASWSDHMNDRLARFAEILPGCHILDELSIETTLTPRWDYLFASSVGKLLSSLPSTLTTLTLDTSASDLISGNDGIKPVHVCPIISQRLQSFQTVRLRMRCMCSCVFNKPSGSPSSRLQTLVIRLNLPDHMTIFHGNTRRLRFKEFHAKSCTPAEMPLHQEIILAGTQLAQTTSSITKIRISYKDLHSLSIRVADCVRGRILKRFGSDHDADNMIGVEDGPCEDQVDLQDDGPLQLEVPSPLIGSVRNEHSITQNKR